MIADPRARYFTGRIQALLFQRLLNNGFLLFEDVLILYRGNRNDAKAFRELLLAHGVAREDLTSAVIGKFVYIPSGDDA